MPDLQQAPAPTRATGSLMLSYGLVAIPVQVFAGIEDVSTPRTEWIEALDGTYLKVGRQMAVKNDDSTYGRPVDPAEVIKRVEAPNGDMIELSDAEIAMALDLGENGAEIVAFQPIGLFNGGAYMPEGVMQMRAARKNTAALKAFDLLMRGMRARSVFALVRYTMRGGMRYGALLGNGRFLSLRYDNEIREAVTLPTVPQSDEDLEMVTAFIDARTAERRIGLVNNVAGRLSDYIESKIAGDFVDVEPSMSQHPATPDVAEIMDRLRRSVEIASSVA